MSYSNLKRLEFWTLIVCGLVWMDAGAGQGLLVFVLAAIPGATMLTAATGFLMFPGDPGTARTGALGSAAGLCLAVPVVLVEPVTAIGLGAASLAGMVACGLIGVDGIPVPEGLHRPAANPRLGLEVGTDEAVLGVAAVTMGIFSSGGQSAVAQETQDALEWFRQQGWQKDPSRFHETPEAPESSEILFEARSVAGLPLEVMSFESGYTARPEAPGGRRYMDYGPCHRAWAWVIRGDERAPWLVNIHGLSMGAPRLDLKLLQARMLHRELGLNLVFPVLPLHGPRALGRVSGRGYLTGNVMDTIHAQSQAIWDIRRIIGWLWAQGVERIGLHGVSLGGYTAALVASLEEGLRCVVAGIPAADPAWLMWWHASLQAREDCIAAGLTEERLEQALRVVSPLAMDPRIPGAHRYIYAGLADRFVPPVLPERLWEHWGQPDICWYPGAHLSILWHKETIRFLRGALQSRLIES